MIVKKIVKKKDIFNNFPINIAIDVQTDAIVNKLTIHKPGKIHFRQLEPKSSIYYQIDISKLNTRVVISLTS